MSDWNSNQYIKFEKERTQPSVDLISRINIIPKTVLDVGCGPGNSTNKLYVRFPNSEILGIDSSENMLDKAEKTYPHLKFFKCRVPEDMDKIENFDLIFSNACLQWVPDHRNLFPKLMDKLNPKGMLAVQIPLVQNSEFYRVLNKVTANEKWKKLRNIKVFHNLLPNETYDVLLKISDDVTMWDTTYYHIVPSHDSVIEWYMGSGLRPYIDMLNQEEETEFLRELLEMLKSELPVQADNSVILKMPRLFFTASKG